MSLNPLNWFQEDDNAYQACFSDVSGLNVSANSIYSNNLLGYHPVKSHGVEIGYFNIKEVDKDFVTKLEIIIPKRFNVSVDSTLEIVKNPLNLFKGYNDGYINLVSGTSSESLRDDAYFTSNSCKNK